MSGMDELLQEIAELPCANTPLYAAHQLGQLDYEPEHPALGEVLCFSECHACRARVRAIELLKAGDDNSPLNADGQAAPVRSTGMRAAWLQERLTTFARQLAGETYIPDLDSETSTEELIERAVVECKASIGRALLEALGVKP